ncbi:hypothetical protein P3S67_011667 [Capsicum chacoense]
MLSLLTNMDDPDSYKNIHIESLHELHRQFDELQRDLADFGARLSDEKCLIDNNNNSSNNN